MADPSTLLLLTCVGCPPAPQPSVQPPLPVCQSNQEQDRTVPSVEDVRPCVPNGINPERITPDVILVARSPESQDSQTRQLPTQPNAPDAVPSVNWSNQSDRLTQTPLLRLGSQGQAVSTLQTRLRQLGYNPGAIDSVYGAVTQAAVIQFQRDRGLNPDGVVGTETWAALQTPNPQRQSEPRTQETEPNRDAPRPDPNSSNSNSQDSNSQDPNSQDLNSQDSNDRSPVPATETTQPTADSTQPDTSFPLQYLWIVGWAAIYLGGWGFLLKDLIKELAGLNGVKPITRRKDFDAALKQRTTQRRDAKPIGVTIVLPSSAKNGNDTHEAQSQHASHSVNDRKSTEKNSNLETNSNSVTLQPQDTGSEPSPSLHSVETNGQHELDDRPLDITLANQGQVRALQNVFIELRRASSSKNTQPTANHSSVTTNTPVNIPENNQKIATPSIQVPESNSESNSDPIEDNIAHETLVAILPATGDDGEPCTYELVNNADGLFVLRGNQLRVVNRYLNENETNLSCVITLRRSDAKGSVEKSFKLDIEGIRKLSTSTPELARG